MQVDTSDPYAGFNSQSTVSAYCNLCFGYLTCGILFFFPSCAHTCFFQQFLHICYITVISLFPGLCLFLSVFSVSFHTNFAPCFGLSFINITVISSLQATAELQRATKQLQVTSVQVLVWHLFVHGDSLQNRIRVSKLSANALPYYNT